MSSELELGEALAEVRAYLEYLGHLGVSGIALERTAPKLGEGPGVAAPAAAPRGFGNSLKPDADPASPGRAAAAGGAASSVAGGRSFTRGSMTAGSSEPAPAPTPAGGGDRFGPSTLGQYGSLLGAARGAGASRSVVAEERPPVRAPAAVPPLPVASVPAPSDIDLMTGEGEPEDPAQTNLLAGLTRAKPQVGRADDRPFTEPPPPDRAAALSALREQVGDCTRCPLSSDRKQVVFGAGSPTATVMIIGDSPSIEEDSAGETFGGPAGDMLGKIVEKVLLLDKAGDVFLTHAVMCRPAGGRSAEPGPISVCNPFLQRQIDIVRPAVIVALGRVAAQAVMGGPVALARVRGHWYSYRGIPVMCTFDPEAVLVDTAKKRPVFEDMKLVRARLDQLGGQS